MTRSPAGARRRFAVIGLAAAFVLAGLGVAVHAFASRTPAPPSLTIHVSPGHRTVAVGTSVTYRVRIGRGRTLIRPEGHGPGRERLAAIVSLGVLAPLPAGLSATFTPVSTRSTSTLLTLGAKHGLRPGSYRVRLAAEGRLGLAPRHRMAHARTTFTIVVPAIPRSRFTVAVTPAGLLAPQHDLPLDLVLTNPDAGALQVGHLAVSITAVRAPEADAAHPCTVADFAIIPFSGAYGFTLPGSRSARLSALGIPAARWPRLAMINRPVNQDGCKHATLSLSFADG
jgi:hypothetical protein